MTRIDGTPPPDLLDQVGQLQRNVLTPRGLPFSGVSDREVQLVADSFDTAHIARQLRSRRVQDEKQPACGDESAMLCRPPRSPSSR